MKAHDFLAKLARSLKARTPDAGPGSELRKATRWTSYMTERILDVAGAANAHVCAKTIPRENEVHERAEYLFDFTLYKSGWKDYSLPIVLIEHENQWNEAAFLRDFWKLMLGYAPLRVMFGYVKSNENAGSLVGTIRAEAQTSSWTYPGDTEDLVLIGHEGMGALDWRILHRAAGSSDWKDSSLPAHTQE